MSNANAAMQYIANRKLDPAQLQDILTDVVADGQRAHDIIHNVREAIKKGSALRGRINLNDVVKSGQAHDWSPMLLRSPAKWKCPWPKICRRLKAIPLQMQQVLINLVRNAMDAMRDTPPNRRKVQIATNYDGNATVRVAVRDHGCGISETAEERLFEQFFTTKEEGLGMGLGDRPLDHRSAWWQDCGRRMLTEAVRGFISICRRARRRHNDCLRRNGVCDRRRRVGAKKPEATVRRGRLSSRPVRVRR